MIMVSTVTELVRGL